MEIRPAASGDFEAVREVARRAWHETYEGVLDEELMDATVDDWYSERSLTETAERPGTALLVAVEDGDVIGFCHGVVVGDEGDVLRLYVDPERWGEGVGTALFERFREDLVDFNMRRLRAMVLADNERGAAFYESLGFERSGEAETELGGETYREAVYTLDLRTGPDVAAGAA